MNCKICKLVYMLQHPELMYWAKCPSCGFCEFLEETHDKYPKTCKYAKHSPHKDPVCRSTTKCECSLPNPL